MKELYKNKYLKYKQKYLDLKGGFLQKSKNYELIESIGFELECSDLSLFYGEIKDSILNLTPFGYNEDSTDSTQNRSLIKVNLGNIETEHGIGEFVMSQDSYELFENTQDTYISIHEALTIELDNKDKIFELNDTQGDIKNIKLHIDSSQNLTFGDVELMVTFLSLQNKTEDMIINITDDIFKFIENIFDDKNITYIGDVLIDYDDFKRSEQEILTRRTSIIYKIFKLPYKVNDKDIYIFSAYQTTTDLNKSIIWTPQVTFGCKLKNFYDVINTLTNYTQVNSVNTEINMFIKFIDEIALKEYFVSEIELKIVKNYLLFLCMYIFRSTYRGYTIKEDTIDIHKFNVPVLPRQNFNEIINMNGLENIFDVLKKYLKNILLFSINSMRKTFKLNEITFEDLNYYFVSNHINSVSIVNIDDKFIEYAFQDYILLEEKKENIKKIILNQVKSLTEYNEKDLFTTFTTKIPYKENIIFEYRDLNSSFIQKIYELKKDNILTNETYPNTLETFRTINAYNKK